jgi:hypothetical protein
MQKSRHTCVVSLRCSVEQRADLGRRAAGQQIGAYLRATLFPSNDNAPLPRQPRKPSENAVALAQALAQLGQISTQLKDRARAAELTGVPTEDYSTSVRQELSEIKSLLMKGLGVRER